jgi:hypothetical protein
MSAPGRRAERLLVSIKLQVIGMALLLAAVTVATFVVIRLIFNDTAVGLLFAGAVGGAGVTIWYLLPKAKHLNQID